jgi:hypothetical protein
MILPTFPRCHHDVLRMTFCTQRHSCPPTPTLLCTLQAQLGFIRVLFQPLFLPWEDAHSKLGWCKPQRDSESDHPARTSSALATVRPGMAKLAPIAPPSVPGRRGSLYAPKTQPEVVAQVDNRSWQLCTTISRHVRQNVSRWEALERSGGQFMIPSGPCLVRGDTNNISSRGLHASGPGTFVGWHLDDLLCWRTHFDVAQALGTACPPPLDQIQSTQHLILTVWRTSRWVLQVQPLVPPRGFQS